MGNDPMNAQHKETVSPHLDGQQIVLPIVYVLNDAYWEFVLVSAKSALLHATCELAFYFLHDGSLSKQHQAMMQHGLPGAQCHFVLAEMGEFADFPAWHGSSLVWARCRLAQLLPEISDWVCLCDGDTLWFRDAADLLQETQQAPESVILLGSHHNLPVDEDMKVEWFAKRDMTLLQRNCICLGFALVHVGRLRAFDIVPKVRAFIDQYGIPPFFEQTLFTWLLQGRLQVLSLPWGIFSHGGNAPRVRWQDYGVIHYATDLPWNRRWRALCTDVVEMWWIAKCQVFRMVGQSYCGRGWKSCIQRLLGEVITRLRSTCLKPLFVGDYIPLPLRELRQSWIEKASKKYLYD